MKGLFILLILTICLSCNTNLGDQDSFVKPNYLTDIEAFTQDSLVNVVIEIPAGCNQKWEVNKTTGQIEWEQTTPNSFRMINYLPYPANYGFVPQTLLHEGTGGDGDPVDVFVLGPSIDREKIVRVRIVGIIHLLDDNESDPKLLAVSTGEPGFDVNTFEALNNNYPGLIDIIKLWLINYKGSGKVEILSVNDEKEALRFLKTTHIDYINK